jgi:hypothetical protein
LISQDYSKTMAEKGPEGQRMDKKVLRPEQQKAQ